MDKRLQYSTEKSTRDIESFLTREDLKGITKPITRKYKSQSYRSLCTKLFLSYMDLIIEDTIERGIAVKLPTHKPMSFYVRKAKIKTKDTDYNVFDNPDKYIMNFSYRKGIVQYNYFCYVSNEMQDRIDYNAFNGVGYHHDYIKL